MQQREYGKKTSKLGKVCSKENKFNRKDA